MLTLLAFMGVASAETVASVLMVEGQVYVTTDGQERAATVGMEIDRDSEIAVDLDASLYVLLHNNRVVALGEDIEIPAARISGVDDSQVASSVKDQLAEILSPSDRERLGPMVTQAEGIGGWHGRLTAAQGTVRGSAPSKSRARSAPPKSAPMADEAGAPAPGAGGAAPPPPPAPPPAGPGLSVLVADYQPGGASSKCLKKWAKTLVKAGTESVELTVKVDDAGAVEAVFTMEGEPVPDCLVQELMGKAVAGELGTELRLK